jgi:uncharacterized protein YlxW (UPF0749 family)
MSPDHRSDTPTDSVRSLGPQGADARKPAQTPDVDTPAGGARVTSGEGARVTSDGGARVRSDEGARVTSDGDELLTSDEGEPVTPDEGEPDVIGLDGSSSSVADAAEDRAAGPGAETTAWKTLALGLRPRASRGQVLAGVLCALLGFAVIAQVRQTQVEGLSSLRQSDLVRILDESTQRSEQLQQEAATLEQTRQGLVSGSDRQKAALQAATQRAETQGILSGRLPAHGPGIEITITEQAGQIPAMDLLNVLEELRNAGAEVVQLGDQRLIASSHFADGKGGVEVDGVEISAPYHWIAIGDPETMAPALEIPGGAMATIRHDGGRGVIVRQTDVNVSAIRSIPVPKFATPASSGGN